MPKTVEWINDPETAYLIDRSDKVVTLSGCYEWCDAVLRDDTKNIFALVTREERAHIGNCGLFEISQRSRKAKLWIYIGDKRHRGKGFGREAVLELLAHGFDTLDLNRIYLYVVEDNVQAKALYESVGFIKEGTFRQDTYLDGKFKDTIYYGILKNEFKIRGEKHGCSRRNQPFTEGI